MGLKAIISGSNLTGLFRSGCVKAIDTLGSPSPLTPELDFSKETNSMYIPLIFGFQIQ